MYDCSPSFDDGRLRATLAERHSMGMPSTTGRWTAEMLRALPDDGRRYEIVRGALLVTPSPSWTHQRAVTLLVRAIANYLDGLRLAEVLIAPADVELESDTVVQPDVFVVPRVGGKSPRRWTDVGRMLLAIEILSPSTTLGDRVVKRRLYLEHAIAEYWIVDLENRCVERWLRGDERAEIVRDALEWRAGSEVAPLVLDLRQLFAEVLED